ncbi:MAG: hypothetical protein ACM3IJ_05725 [Candidatus Levyibacteriota bacterium]
MVEAPHPRIDSRETHTPQRVAQILAKQPHVSGVHFARKPKVFGYQDLLEAQVSFDDGDSRSVNILVLKTAKEMDLAYDTLLRRLHLGRPKLQEYLARLGVVILRSDFTQEYLEGQWAKKVARISESHKNGQDLEPRNGFFIFNQLRRR